MLSVSLKLFMLNFYFIIIKNDKEKNPKSSLYQIIK